MATVVAFHSLGQEVGCWTPNLFQSWGFNLVLFLNQLPVDMDMILKWNNETRRFLCCWKIHFSGSNANTFACKTDRLSCSMVDGPNLFYVIPQSLDLYLGTGVMSKPHSYNIIGFGISMVKASMFLPKLRFFNMRTSASDSIRKPPSAISWVFSLVNLSAWGHTDSGSLIKAWKLGWLFKINGCSLVGSSMTIPKPIKPLNIFHTEVCKYLTWLL